MSKKNKTIDTINVSLESSADEHKPVLSLCSPAANWSNGIPLGNGRLGTMMWGGPFETYITLNADRLWRNNIQYELEDKSEIFKEIRRLCREKRWAGAEALSQELTPKNSSGSSFLGVNSYQPAAQIRVSVRHNCGAQGYKSQLDLNEAVCRVAYNANNNAFEWLSFVSAVNDVSVTKITSNGSSELPVVRIDLVRPISDRSLETAKTQAASAVNVKKNDQTEEKCDYLWEVKTDITKDGILVLSGRSDEGVSFAAAVAVMIDSGEQRLMPIPATVLHSVGHRAEIKNAKSIIFLANVYVDTECSNPVDECLSRLRHIKKITFKELYDSHVEDYKSFSTRCSVNLGGQTFSEKTNTELLQDCREKSEASPALLERMFEMGRYLMISGSRPGTLPLNLQGIWNNDLSPAWSCDFHYNINIQMAYWPVEVANLSECHLPLAELLNQQIPAFKNNAKQIFGMNGLMLPNCSDLTGRFNMGFWNLSPCTAAWMSQHLWWHWEYTQDKNFLQYKAIPFMTEAIKFYLDYIQIDDGGNIIITPGYSPENKADDRNAFFGQNAEIDLAFIKELFGNYINAGSNVDVDWKIVLSCKKLLEKWPEPGIDKDGKLSEMEDAVYDHFQRHLSHLVGLYPASIVSAESDPKLLNAYRKAMEHRKYWGFDDWMDFTWVWMGLLHARLGEAEEAAKCLDVMAQAFFMDNLLSSCFDFRRLGWGTVWADTSGDTPWLFQVEGNMGVTALIAEMLLQSHNGVVRILPALPGRWPNGQFRRLKARGGFEVSAIWAEGRVRLIEIKSICGSSVDIRIPAKCAGTATVMSKDKVIWVGEIKHPNHRCAFDTVQGDEYKISIDYQE
ncbi:MAG: glycoside hydrolase family 95 protein [Planctomycetaceae bacterium]|nr:glycoside hydrolase family 95 protein [Planctomycetaceae bacterium]